ncbi:MAG: family 20 glycosylhydrolase [Porphyromonadaceae bacterium]|nr:family 20 glycosylhydrolase [Porphyromonadaceae bacterium]
MRKFILKTLFLIFPLALFPQNTLEVSIIPEPVSMVKTQGSFILPKEITLIRPAGAANDYTVDFLKNKISKATGSRFKISNSGQGNLRLVLNKTHNSSLGSEGYTLSVNPQRILITANTPAGLFYGAQSLIQLFPPEIESKSKVSDVMWQIPAVEIADYPRVQWRGLMFDVARHFFTVEEVKRYIDQMSRYKYNRLHLGLTNDEGWRIEIKSLPKLTEIGAWRVEKIGNFGTFSPPLPDEPKNYGGYYTHEQIRDLVKYAKQRFVEIMPEINGPGHSLAAIASYPELASTPEAKNYSVRAGEPIIDWYAKPRHTSYIDNNLSPANEVVYEFLDKVITEVAELFPFEYIHCGGDETTYNFWEKSPEIAALMKRENLKNMAEVQSYFGKRYEKIIQSKGKKMMGWDEILEGGITPTTGLMSWRGINHGIEASKSGHYVVMSPTTFAYIDFMQGDAATEAPVYASLRLNKTYEFNPVPEEANAKFILGGQANLWTEQIYNFRQAEYMTWPRGFAIIESLWSPQSKKNWNNFIRKTEDHFKRYDFAEVKYSPAIYDPIVSVKKEGEAFYVELTPEISGLDIYTSFDNSTPDYFYPKYTKPQLIPKDARLMRIVTYKGKSQAGRVMTITVEDLKKRAD